MPFKKGPWTVNETSVAYKNQWVEVNEDTIVRPDGLTVEFTVVRLKPGVSVLAIDDDETVYDHLFSYDRVDYLRFAFWGAGE